MPSSLHLSVHIEEWASKIPFRIAGFSWNTFKVVLVELSDGKHVGRGEGLPVYYLHETVDGLYRQIEGAAGQIERGIDREALLKLLPAGGARNAVDSALWDLEAKCHGRTIWELTGIEPRSVATAFTIGIEDTPEAMASRAIEASIYPILKIKVGEDRPVERVAAIRAARPDAGLVVDANQGWTFEQLFEVAPKLAELGVKLVEQPLPRGADEPLEGYTSPIPLSADESCQHRGELDQASRRYQIINIKLDKAGGLTEALLLAQAVRDRGLELLVSNMGGTSLSMAPAFVVAQLCQYVELDGQLILKHDRFPSLPCHNGKIAVPDSGLWG
jgi:L-alanine-DL-glutamate epimerase-like enolase superfamily enzyme